MLNDDIRAKWDRLWHFFRISQQFGEWKVEMGKASEKERDLILKTQEIFTKYDVFDKPELIDDMFSSLSEKEKSICLEGLEVILKYMRYCAGFKSKDESSERG